MPLNRELLASLTFEPFDTSDDSSSSGSDDYREPIEKVNDADNDGDEDSGQNEATKLVICCLKVAITESVISVSHPEKQRPLDPKSDFTIEATTEYSVKKAEDFSCCGPNSIQTKSRRRSGGARDERRGRRRYSETSWGRQTSDDSSRFFSPGRDGGTSGAVGNLNDRPVGSQARDRGTDYFDVMGARQRSRRGANSEAATASEDDEYEVEEEDALRVDFKFTDYSPMCYRHIREFFGVDPKEYCDVLRYSRWHSIPTPGKSAAQLFFCGRDWVIKTMTHTESEFLRGILHRYYYHVRDNPFTFLPHFVGHHQLRIGGETHNFIIMQNVFATTNTIHEKFDLKGSTIGRYASEAEKLKATCTQKDLDIHRPLHIGPERRQLVIDQVKADCDFLKRSKIMDYSFLVGIHILPQKRLVMVPGSRGLMNAGETFNATQTAAPALSAALNSSVLAQPLDVGPMTACTVFANSSQAGGGGGIADSSMLMGAQQSQAPADALDGCCFTCDQGGMMSNDTPGLRSEIYYIGIIDILQEYNARKRLETAVFGTINDFHRISCVNPHEYAARFISFMSSIIV